MKFTILMPVYNAGKFLERSINSVKQQTYDDWELMCVDDGSVDDSLALLKSYASEDSRIKVLQTPRNMGPMGARRLGFEKSCGSYIVYLDADDRLSDDYLYSIHKRVQETGADLVFPDLVHVSIMGGQNSFFQDHHVDKSILLTGIEGFADTFPWTKIGGLGGYKREIFEASTYHSYLQGNNFNADEVLQRIMLLNAKKVAFCDGAYYYMENPASITHVLTRRSFCRLDANKSLIKLAYDYQVPADVLDKVYSFCFFCQLKGLCVNLYFAGMDSEDRDWTMEKMKAAWKEYTKYDGVNSFYGKGAMARLKAKLFTSSWLLFKLLCWLQAKKQR